MTIKNSHKEKKGHQDCDLSPTGGGCKLEKCSKCRKLFSTSNLISETENRKLYCLPCWNEYSQTPTFRQKQKKLIAEKILDFQILVSTIANKVKWDLKKNQDNYQFFLELDGYLEQTHHILSDSYSNTMTKKGLLSLLREQSN